MTDDCDRRATGFTFFRRKRATEQRLDAEHVEKVCGHSVRGSAYGLDAAGYGGELAIVLSDAVEGMTAGANVEKVRFGERHAAAALVDLAKLDDLLGVGIRKRAE